MVYTAYIKRSYHLMRSSSRSFNIGLLFFIIILLSSCSEYQSVVRSKDYEAKRKMASLLFKDKEYRKAITLYDQIISQYKGTGFQKDIGYESAMSHFYAKDYYLAAYKLNRWIELYPLDSRLEYATFIAGKSYYELSPRYTLDQKESVNAMEKLQTYLREYPDGEHYNEANTLIQKLNLKKERKAYEIAKLYHHRRKYNIAVTALSNFLLDYPGSSFQEKAMYYRLESQYLYAKGSYENLQKERYDKALSFYKKYYSYFSLRKNAAFTDKANDIEKDILEYFKGLKNQPIL